MIPTIPTATIELGHVRQGIAALPRLAQGESFLSLRERMVRLPDGEVPPLEFYIGEQGRGRRQVVVPVPAGAEAVRQDTMTWRVMAVPRPARAPDAVVLLYVGEHSGFRGGWFLRSPAEKFCPFSPDAARAEGREWDPTVNDGRLDAGLGRCRVCGGPGGYAHDLLPAGQPAGQLKPSAIGLVIAEGFCAQGHAGRMGGGPAYLIAARPGRFGIHRTGRLYGEPAFINVTVHEDGTVTTEDAVAALRRQAAARAWAE